MINVQTVVEGEGAVKFIAGLECPRKCGGRLQLIQWFEDKVLKQKISCYHCGIRVHFDRVTIVMEAEKFEGGE